MNTISQLRSSFSPFWCALFAGLILVTGCSRDSEAPPAAGPAPAETAPAPGVPTEAPTPEASTSEAPTESVGEPFRAISWNIEWFPGRSLDATDEAKAQHLREVTAFLPSLEADLLLLQEIGDREATEQILAYDPDMEIHVFTNFLFRGQPGLQQLVIASRYPAVAAFTEQFISDHNLRIPRGFAFAALEVAPGRLLLVYNVHLQSNRGNPATNKQVREASARQLLQHVNEMTRQFGDQYKIAVAIGGDYNLLLNQEAMADEQTLEILKEDGFHWAWEGVPFEERVTWPARGRFGDANFDHFMLRNIGTPTSEVLGNADLSDHRPVLVILDPNEIR